MIKLSILSLLLVLVNFAPPGEDEFSILGEWQLKTYQYTNMGDEEPFEVDITFTFNDDGTLAINDANGDIFTSSYEFDGKNLTYTIEEEPYSSHVWYLTSSGETKVTMMIKFVSPFEARYFLAKL